MHMAVAADMANHLNAGVVQAEVVDASAKPTQPANFVGPPVAKKKTVTLENAEPAHVKEFFAADRPGRYLMWSGGHVVLVDNKTVHEFSSSKGGYATTDVLTWLEPYKTARLTVRSL